MGLLVTYSGFAMQRPADMPQQRFDILSNLNPDLKLKVVDYLNSGKSLEEVINNIRSLSRVDKAFNEFLNDSQVARFFISELAKRFNTSELLVAFAFKTKGSKSWVDEYIKTQKDETFKREFANILQKAIRSNDIDVVKYIVSKLPSLINEYVLDEGIGYYRTPLVQAIRHGRGDMVEYLLKNKADINLREKKGLFIKNVPPGTMDINWKPNNLSLAVSYAQASNLQIARLLLHAGIARDITQEEWMSIIDSARRADSDYAPGILKLIQDAHAQSKK